jgi:hypothetical protein
MDLHATPARLRGGGGRRRGCPREEDSVEVGGVLGFGGGGVRVGRGGRGEGKDRRRRGFVEAAGLPGVFYILFYFILSF